MIRYKRVYRLGPTCWINVCDIVTVQVHVLLYFLCVFAFCVWEGCVCVLAVLFPLFLTRGELLKIISEIPYWYDTVYFFILNFCIYKCTHIYTNTYNIFVVVVGTVDIIYIIPQLG